ncbi:MAG: hypothetical protein E7642_08105 [Ruminococcaceae bacterium]|nr:hypothetical protein [Oscillospiraceae bacterium]
MKKEVITRDKIKHDLDYEVKKSTMMSKGIIIVAAVLLIISAMFFGVGGFIEGIIFLIFTLAVIAELLHKYLKFKKQKQALYISNINVIQSKFYSFTVETPRTSYGRKTAAHDINYVLRFSAGEWIITLVKQPPDTYRLYTWSENYTMSLIGLDNISLSGDDFFLVVDEKKQKVIYAYPAKFFECDTELL